MLHVQNSVFFLYSITFGHDKKIPKDWILYRQNMKIIINFIFLLPILNKNVFSFRLNQTFKAQRKTIKNNDKVTLITNMFLVPKKQASLVI